MPIQWNNSLAHDHEHWSRLMKKILISGMVVLVVCVQVKAQVTNNPNTISGTVRFSNVNPAILSLLDAPGNEGLKYLYMQASSVPPAEPRASAAFIDPPTGRLSSSYAITVDADAGGTRYSVIPRASLIDNRETYYFNARTSAVVFPIGLVPALDFSECVGVLTVRFRTAGGSAAVVDSGSIVAVDPVPAVPLATLHGIPAGSTAARIYLRGGDPFLLQITAVQGTDTYSDRLSFYWESNVTVACDAFRNIEVTLPSVGSLGKIVARRISSANSKRSWTGTIPWITRIRRV